MKNKFYILGFSFGVMAIVLGLGINQLFDFSGKKMVCAGICLFGGLLMGFVGNKALSKRAIDDDEDIKREYYDERNTMIREKASYNANCINIVLLGIAAIVFISLNYIIPAIVVTVILVIQPIVMIVCTELLEKRY